MSKPRYMRILDKVREEVAVEKAKDYPYIRPWELAEKLNVKESVINQACSVLQKEGVLSPWRGSRGTYSVKTRPRATDLGSPFPPNSNEPRKMRVSWGSKRRVLAIIRKTKPWVVEKWHDREKRWYMYMEDGCDCNPTHFNVTGCMNMRPVSPEDQPDLTRTVIARWHFDLDGAIQACAIVRRRHPKETFRTRDTSKGDYVMGAIL